MKQGYWNIKPRINVKWYFAPLKDEHFDFLFKEQQEYIEEEVKRKALDMVNTLQELYSKLHTYFKNRRNPQLKIENISKDIVLRKDYLLPILNLICQHIANEEDLQVNIHYTTRELNISFTPETSPSTEVEDILL